MAPRPTTPISSPSPSSPKPPKPKPSGPLPLANLLTKRLPKPIIALTPPIKFNVPKLLKNPNMHPTQQNLKVNLVPNRILKRTLLRKSLLGNKINGNKLRMTVILNRLPTPVTLLIKSRNKRFVGNILLFIY